MDVASVQADEQFAYATRARDETLAKLSQSVSRLRLEAGRLESGNRFQRRKAKIAVRRIEAFEAWMGARIQQVFAGVTKDYNPKFGIFDDVHREAASKLAAIFK